MYLRRLGAGLAAAALMAGLVSCGKDEQEAAKFERADSDTFVREMSDVSSFTLSNGIVVYLQEERTADQVAVEVLYRAGFMDEPRGKPQLSHVAEHLTIHCGAGDLGPEGAVKLIQENRGMINAETVSDFSHIDYVVRSERLEKVLEIEALRMTSVNCDEATRRTEMDKVMHEIDEVVTNPKGSLAKYGMMALNQALYHGEKFVPIRSGAEDITNEDAAQFLRQYYRPNDAVVVIIGNLDKAEMERLVRKHLEPLPRRDDPPARPTARTGNIAAKWDIDAQAFYLVAPGPYANERERLILTMFGSYLHQALMTTEEVYGPCRSVYASNQVYRVDDIPFFVFAEPGMGYTIADIRPSIRDFVMSLAGNLEDGRIDAIKSGMVSFVTTTTMKRDVPDYPLGHHQVIGQEALNIGMKHSLREGRPLDEFVAEINAISPDEFRTVVGRYINNSTFQEVTFTKR
jgi:zinc protease